MSCQHPNCSLETFTVCPHHCSQNLCLKHALEHSDDFLRDFKTALDHLDETTHILIDEANAAAERLMKRREYEIEQINCIYDKQQRELKRYLTFAENGNELLIRKQEQVKRSKQEMKCYIYQYDIEQIKIYSSQMGQYDLEKIIKQKQEEDNHKEEEESKESDPSNDSSVTLSQSSKTYSCPLTRPNVFGITENHNLRCNCEGASYPRYSLRKHLEYYHRMLPEYAARLVDGIIGGQSGDDTKLFSEDEILRNDEYFLDCPLTDPTNIFGAQKSLNKIKNFPCTRKQLTLPSIQAHFQLYHRMNRNAAKKLFLAIRDKSLNSDSILFGHNEMISGQVQKKRKSS